MTISLPSITQPRIGAVLGLPFLLMFPAWLAGMIAFLERERFYEFPKRINFCCALGSIIILIAWFNFGLPYRLRISSIGGIDLGNSSYFISDWTIAGLISINILATCALIRHTQRARFWSNKSTDKIIVIVSFLAGGSFTLFCCHLPVFYFLRSFDIIVPGDSFRAGVLFFLVTSILLIFGNYVERLRYPAFSRLKIFLEYILRVNRPTKKIKFMKNVVIVTAKGGNTSVQNKNCIPILGLPVMLYPLRAAKLAVKVDAVYVSSEDPMILDMAQKEGARLILRPEELSRPESQHKDVIRHAVEAISSEHPGIENFVVLLGNTVQVTSGLIDRCLTMLEDPECDSVATVWKAQDDHPYRAMRKDELGYMRSFGNKEVGSNRQSYPEVYFYDQGIWAFRKHCAMDQKGPVPWVWLGEKCRMVERPWVTGRDIHSWIDISASAWYLTSIQANDFMDYNEL